NERETKRYDESVLTLAEEQKVLVSNILRILHAEGERNSLSEEHGVSKETRLKASAELEIERLTGAKNEIIIDENDERLNRLKHEFGQAAYDLVTATLMDMNEGPSGRCITTKLWNYKLERKATLNEGITFALP
ncbi:hypothetical protein H5410_036364, partial [Solanum commersonii]